MISLDGVFSEIAQRASNTLTPSQWAESKRYLSSEFSPKAGKVNYDYSPYLREIVDCFSKDSPVQQVTVLKGSQIGATQLIIETLLGYIIDVAPSSLIYVSESKDVVETNVSTRIDNMIYSAGLHDKIKPSSQFTHGKKTGNTKRVKEFAGGIIYAKGANEKPININAQYLIFDELDKVITHKLGDVVDLWKKRQSVYTGIKKTLLISTPQKLSRNRTKFYYDIGDRRHYFCKCPNCNNEFSFLWTGWQTPTEYTQDATFNFIYTKKSDFQVIPESVGFVCRACKHIIRENERFNLLLKGQWKPTVLSQVENCRSYYAPQFLSNFVSLADICDSWLPASRDKQKLEVFFNEVCGEVWIDAKSKIDDRQIIRKNAKNYAPRTVPNTLAQKHGHGRICVLTAAIDINAGQSGDVNQGWADFIVNGHCADGTVYAIAKAHVYGKICAGGDVWAALEEMMNMPYYSDDGLEYYINAICVDTGYNPEMNIKEGNSGAVFDFCRKNGVYAVKGSSTILNRGYGLRFKLSKNKVGERLYICDTTRYKIEIFTSLLLSESADGVQEAGFFNFPNDKIRGGFENLEAIRKTGVVLADNGFDRNFVNTFASEIPVYTDETEETIKSFQKVNSRANTHDLDVLVYNRLARDIFLNTLNEEYYKGEPRDNFTLLEEIEAHINETGTTL